MKRIRLLHLFTLVLILLSLSSLAFFLLKEGLPSGHDIAAHAIRSQLFIEALQEGQFPVRWTNWINDGESEPLFNFYQVGFYYVVALVHLFASITLSLKITVLLLWWLGAAFMFLWMKKFGTLPAALSALIYTFTPYLISDVFVRAAYPEVTAISFGVGVLWSLDKLLTTSKPIFGLPLALSLLIIITSHLPTLVILSPIFLIYAIFLIYQGQVQTKGITLVLVSIVLGLGLSSFYLLPALGELSLIQNSKLTSNYYDFHPHFAYLDQLLRSPWGYGISLEGKSDGMSFQLGTVQWIILALSLVLIFYKKASKLKPWLIFWILIMLYGIFFATDISINFWESSQIIAFIQYPWRFLMVIPLASAALGGVLILLLPKSNHQVVALFTTLALIILLYFKFLSPAVFLPESYFQLDTPNWRESQGVLENAHYEEGYLPKQVARLPRSKIGWWTIVDGQANIKEQKLAAHQVRLMIEASTPITVRINIHNFPGWKVYLDNIETNIQEDELFGFLVVKVPPGLHTLEANFTNTPIRSLANLTTVISIILLSIWQLLQIKFIRKLFKGLTVSEGI